MHIDYSFSFSSSSKLTSIFRDEHDGCNEILDEWAHQWNRISCSLMLLFGMITSSSRLPQFLGDINSRRETSEEKARLTIYFNLQVKGRVKSQHNKNWQK